MAVNLFTVFKFNPYHDPKTGRFTSGSGSKGSSPSYRPGDRVSIPYKGKMTEGKVMRYVAGSDYEAEAYLVDVGDYESARASPHSIKPSRGEVESPRYASENRISEARAAFERPSKKMTSEVMDAYADASQEGDAAMQKRNLQYLASESVSATQAATILKKAVPGGYNSFNPSTVARTLKKYPNVSVRIAREYSPALYVEGDLESLTGLLKEKGKMMADEADIHTSPVKTLSGETIRASRDKPVLRMWWD